MTRNTITLFGNFGTQNLGNEYTLKAILENLRERLPGARFDCVCPDPQDATKRYGIEAALMSYRYGKDFRSAGARSPRVIRWLRRIFLRVPREMLEWLQAFRRLRKTRLLVMTGTGMLGDFGIGPLDLHYEILKWSILAKMSGSKLLFVSVGAGPIESPLSRWIVKRAVSLADYRSYRDTFSKEYLAGIGFDTRGDSVYPDLAFSLTPDVPKAPREHLNGRVVGVGLMDYYGRSSDPEQGSAAYRRYLEKVTAFVAFLLQRGYTVKLLTGDLSYDTRVKRDLLAMLEERRPPASDGRLIDPLIGSVEELVAQLATADLVVATRFHNILLSLMLRKPVVALSYHPKIASLMSGVGMSEYCQDIEASDPGGLIERFSRLERNEAAIRSLIVRKTGEYERALDEQYTRIASLFGSA